VTALVVERGRQPLASPTFLSRAGLRSRGVDSAATAECGSVAWPISLSLLSLAAVVYACVIVHSGGTFGGLGDEAAHLLHARRVFDSATPGFGQLGQYWPPLYQILELPFAWSDTLYRSGWAATLPSALCYLAAVAGAYRLGFELTGHRRPAAIAGLAMGANPNLLHLSSVAMMESSTVMALVWAGALMARFSRTASFSHVVYAGLAAGVAAWAHYGAWGMPVYGALIVIHVGRRRGWTWSKVRTFVAGFLLAASYPAVVWLGWNYFLQDDPLYFVHFGMAGTATASTPTPLMGQPGNLTFAVADYGLAALDVFGPVATAAAAAVLIAALLRRRFVHPIGMTLAAAGFVVTAFTLAGGAIGSTTFAAITHSTLPSVVDDSNIRYALFLAPFIAGSVAVLAGRSALRQAAVILSLLAGLLWYGPAGIGVVTTSNPGEMKQAELDAVVGDRIAASCTDRRTLISSIRGGDRLIWRSGLHASGFVTEFNGDLFMKARGNPVAFGIDCVVLAPGSSLNSPAFGHVLERQGFAEVWSIEALAQRTSYVLLRRGAVGL
jgi:Dolichyl-phosphate-mannose-protein mannosyltransferase